MPAQNPASAYFEDVDVTDNNGAAQAITAGGLVPVTPANPYGVAKVEISLSEDNATYDLAQLIGLLPDNALTYTISITTPGDGNHARVYKAAPTVTTNGYATQEVGCVLTFNRASGTWSLAAANTSETVTQPANVGGTGSLKFYYSAENASTSTSAAETSTDHANDNIKVSIS